MLRRFVPVLVSHLALTAASASTQTKAPDPAPAPAPQPAQAAKADEAPAFKISGLVYGDYYYVAANHRDELDGQNGFWLRRVYFTYDHTLSKAFSLRFRLELNSKGWQDRPDGRDVSTLEAFAGWQEAKWRASLQYGRQERREAAPGGLDLDLEFLSAFAMVQVTPKLAVVGRLDRSFDEVPNGETIDYMPFSETARALFGYAGVDVTLAKTVHLIPNVEWTSYGQGQDGTTPASDLVPRVTLFFSW